MSDFGPAAQEGARQAGLLARLSLRRLGNYIRSELNEISIRFLDNEDRDLEAMYETWGQRLANHGYTPGEAATLLHDEYRDHCIFAGRAVDGSEADTHYTFFCQRLRNFGSGSVVTVVGGAAALALKPDACNDQAFAAKLDAMTQRPYNPNVGDFFNP